MIVLPPSHIVAQPLTRALLDGTHDLDHRFPHRTITRELCTLRAKHGAAAKATVAKYTWAEAAKGLVRRLKTRYEDEE